MRSAKTEFDNFNHTMQKLIRVSHSDIKAKLEAEKAEKQKRKGKKNDQRDQNPHRSEGYSGDRD